MVDGTPVGRVSRRPGSCWSEVCGVLGGGGDGGGGGGVGMACAPGGLSAGGCAVALASGGGERRLADRAGRGRPGVVTDVVTRRGCWLRACRGGRRTGLDDVVTDVVTWRGHRGWFLAGVSRMWRSAR